MEVVEVKDTYSKTPLIKGEVKILTAETAGVCFGVERALQMSEKAIKDTQNTPLYSLGPLIHNPQAVKDLEQRGLAVADSLENVQGTVVFRSHGATIQVQEKAKEMGLKIVDATCPLVKVPQNFARKLSQNGYFVVIVGDKNHPEIQGVQSYVQNERFLVVKTPEEINAISAQEKVGVICQTTLKKSLLESVVEACRGRFSEVKVHNTICSATKDRQEAALTLAQEAECMVVIGGRNSSNTQKLFDICAEHSEKAYLIETPDEMKPEWFTGFKTIGVTAGASTPFKLIEDVRQKIAALI